MTLPRFLAAAGTLDDVGAGGAYRLDEAEARHAAAARRIGVGEAIEVADGAGTVVRGVAESVGPDGVLVRVADRRREPPPAVRLVLVQALAKGDRDEQAVEAATEVGVDAVVPWQSRRSVSVWRGARQERGERRWAAVVAAAAKQSRRAWVPQVRPLVRGSELVQVVAGAGRAGSVVVVLHEEAEGPLSAVPLPATGEVLVVVGPEGGLDAGEVAELTTAGAVLARLGPHVLRTSTAGPVALALLADRLGRWGGSPAAR